MASVSITSWQTDEKKMETMTDFIFLGSKTTANGDCSHEIKRRLLLGRKVVTNPDSILKRVDITLPTKVYLVKAMVSPVVMYGCESWTIKKTERLRIDAFELWCWRRLLRVPWTTRRSKQSILKQITPEYSLECLMVKMKHTPLLIPCGLFAPALLRGFPWTTSRSNQSILKEFNSEYSLLKLKLQYFGYLM